VKTAVMRKNCRLSPKKHAPENSPKTYWGEFDSPCNFEEELPTWFPPLIDI